MKFLVLSDLHLEFAEYVPPRGVLEGVDAVILAGDTMPNCWKLPAWATKPGVFGPDVPILIVLGNHEFYGGQIEIRRREIQDAAAAFSNVHVLDPGEVLLDGQRIRVLGCTLWTDFELPIQTRLPTEATGFHAEACSSCHVRRGNGDIGSSTVRQEVLGVPGLLAYRQSRAYTGSNEFTQRSVPTTAVRHGVPMRKRQRNAAPQHVAP